MFKKLSLIVAGLMLLGVGHAKSLEVDAAHSSIRFEIRHLMISTVEGRFGEFEGTIKDAGNGDLSSAKIDFTVNAKSIDTANGERDEHLRSDDFFNVENYPKATFVSTEITPTSENRYNLKGELTIRGQTREVEFAVAYLGKNQDPWGNIKHGYEARTRFSRKDFGLTWNQALETGGVLVGDNVDLRINIQAAEK